MIADLLFGLITVFWLSEFIFHRPDRDDSGERKSLMFIWITLSLSISGAATSAHFQLGTFTGHSAWTILGLVLYALGVGLRRWGIYALGSNFSRRVKVTEELTLVSDGPYRLLAHPLYAGIMSALTGICLHLHSWFGLVLVWTLVLTAIRYRIHIEERAMIVRFGNGYSNWLKQRRRIIPFLY